MSFEFDAPKPVSVNLHAHVSCRTCGGDRTVLYSTRLNVTTPWMAERGLKAQGGTDEYAPCPDCNADCNTLRHGFKSPDTAQVRQRLKEGRR